MAQTIDLSGLVRPQLVEATKREDNPNVAEFRLQPLERGFGHTLGNAMRRMLLSSLRGAAVWAFRIDGVLHEHQTIPGVVEDVHQIIGNLKSLDLTLPDDVDEAVLRIQKSEAGPVTAGDVESVGGARIVDPGHHLFTLQDDREINIDHSAFAGYVIDLDARTVVDPQQRPIALTKTELDLLTTFVANTGVVRTRDQLLDAAWGRDVMVAERTVDTFVLSLKKKLGWSANATWRFVAVRGVGYRFEHD